MEWEKLAQAKILEDQKEEAEVALRNIETAFREMETREKTLVLNAWISPEFIKIALILEKERIEKRLEEIETAMEEL